MSIVSMATHDILEVRKQFHAILGVPPEQFSRAALEVQTEPAKYPQLAELLGAYEECLIEHLQIVASDYCAINPVQGRISAYAFDWGFHLILPQSVLQELLETEDRTRLVHRFAGDGLGVLGVPTAQYVANVLEHLLAEDAELMRSANFGQGTYVAWSWLQLPLFYQPEGQTVADTIVGVGPLRPFCSPLS